MALSGQIAGAPIAAADHGYHPLRVAAVVRETADASSFVLDVPADLRPAFSYQAGQFCNFRVWVDGEPYVRCYSMSSSPAVDTELRVTVKRTPDGVVSNWMNDHLGPGDVLDVARPAGFFRLGAGGSEVLLFAAGSGITPVLSLLKTALATTSRRVRLLYANRDLDAVIFRSEIDALKVLHGGRFTLTHHLDAEKGLIGSDTVRGFIHGTVDPECFVCGPAPYMDVVESALHDDGVDAGRIHIERFTPEEWLPAPEPVDVSVGTPRITIALDGRTRTADHHPGTTILQTARQMGMTPPFSCESGSCATCMAKLLEGTASMHVNNALTADEVADGWVLTCQALPTSPSVHVAYDYEEE
jgi:3-ketosteroid 9alpha-monooxygenase subunit B